MCDAGCEAGISNRKLHLRCVHIAHTTMRISFLLEKHDLALCGKRWSSREKSDVAKVKVTTHAISCECIRLAHNVGYL